jgi:glycosyltransferase involved in cell wall biosynthesis
MRILYIATSATTIRAFLLPFIQHYRGQGWEVDVAANGAKLNGLAAECAVLYDPDWTRAVLHLPLSMLAAFRLRMKFRRRPYDLIHVHTPIASFCTRVAMIGLGRRRPVIIYTAHGFHFHSQASRLANCLWRSAEKLAARWTDYLIVMNKEDADSSHSVGILPPSRIRRMPGIGVDVAQWARSKVSAEAIGNFRRSLGLTDEDRLFLMSAEFIPRKRHSDALRAFASLADSHCHLAFAGEGPLRGATQHLARQLGVSERVHFLGFRTDLAVCMAASAAVVLPSSREGLPRSIMEAFCLETPVVASDIRGNRDLVEGNGLLVPLGDIPALAAALRKVLNEPAAIAATTSRALRAMQAYDINGILDLHDRLYAEATAHQRRPVVACSPVVPQSYRRFVRTRLR